MCTYVCNVRKIEGRKEEGILRMLRTSSTRCENLHIISLKFQSLNTIMYTYILTNLLIIFI